MRIQRGSTRRRRCSVGGGVETRPKHEFASAIVAPKRRLWLQGAEYKAALEGVKNAEKELTDWLGTRPERTDENTAKFEKMKQAITDAGEKLAAFWPRSASYKKKSLAA